MKRVLLLATGGTIASREGTKGLAPSLGAGDILGHLAAYEDRYQFVCENFLDMDSSNIQPEQWTMIARRVYAALQDFHAVIITHGTDTMAYTACALSFFLRDLDKSVVLTGSQLPIENPLTDANINLYTAMEAIEHGVIGVSVAFNRKIIPGTRAVKVSTMGFDAFESINADYLGQLFADGTRIMRPGGMRPTGPCRLQADICSDVFLLKLLPGTRPEIFDALAALGYRGVVIEAFGAGGIHFIGRDLLVGLETLRSRGIAVVVCSQCLYEHCDLSIYEVGQQMLERGVIPGRDMTTEAAATKLMWVLGQTEDPDTIRAMFHTNYAGEINP